MRGASAGRTVFDNRVRAAEAPSCQGTVAASNPHNTPQETRLRLLIADSPLPRPVAQYEIRAHGRFVARVDFAYPDRRLAIEYDGAWHGQPDQLPRDRRRLNELFLADWRVLFVAAADLHRPGVLVARIAAGLAV